MQFEVVTKYLLSALFGVYVGGIITYFCFIVKRHGRLSEAVSGYDIRVRAEVVERDLDSSGNIYTLEVPDFDGQLLTVSNSHPVSVVLPVGEHCDIVFNRGAINNFRFVEEFSSDEAGCVTPLDAMMATFGALFLVVCSFVL